MSAEVIIASVGPEIDPAKYALALHTTLNKLKAAGACADSYKKLVLALGGTSFDHDALINLRFILDSNGTEDCLWALCATVENCDQIARLMAADFAEAVLYLYESKHPDNLAPRNSIRTARRFAIGEATDAERAAAGDAAGDAAWAAARAAARAAAGAAAWAAAGDAAWAAAGDAAWAAAGDAAWAAARAAQKQIILKYLKAE